MACSAYRDGEHITQVQKSGRLQQMKESLTVVHGADHYAGRSVAADAAGAVHLVAIPVDHHAACAPHFIAPPALPNRDFVSRPCTSSRSSYISSVVPDMPPTL